MQSTARCLDAPAPVYAYGSWQLMRTALVPLGRVGEYRLEQRLGVGGMAEVFIARREGPHGFAKRVAIKRILPQLASDPRLVAMFCDEARIQAALSHPNLVQVFDFSEDQGQPFMALELVDGLSGAQLIARLAARRRAVALGPALYIVREVLAALDYVHAATDEGGRPLGIVHRDVAPSNILIGRMGQVKLGDFGIVRSDILDARTVPGELKGKVGYVSPEQAMGLAIDHRSDLFSLGIVLAELLLGCPLFSGQTELEVLESLHRGDLSVLDARGAHIPSDVRAILLQALARWPEQRFQSALELSHALDVAARAHGESMDGHALSAWLSDMGLVAVTSGVRSRPAPTKDAVDALLRQSARLSEPPFSESVTLAAEETEGAAESLESALLLILPDNDTASIPGELAHAVSPPTAMLKQADAPPRYRLRHEAGDVVGPLALANVLEWVATGRCGAEARVSRNDGPFLPVGSVIELSRLSARAAYRFHDAVAMSTTQRWSARLEVLPWLLFELVDQGRTGLLVGQRPGGQVRVYFVDGAPVFSSSTDPQHLLGARLIEAGELDARLLSPALEAGWRSGQRVGEALVHAGLTTRGAVQRATRAQLAARLTSLLRFRDGEVMFVDGAFSGEEPVVVPARELVTEALLDAIEDDEAAQLLAPVLSAGALEPTVRFREIHAQLGSSPEVALLGCVTAETALRDLVDAAPSAALAHRAVLLGLASRALGWTA